MLKKKYIISTKYSDMLPVVKGILKGERRSLARAISIIDNDDYDSQIIIRQIFDKTGKARAVGLQVLQEGKILL